MTANIELIGRESASNRQTALHLLHLQKAEGLKLARFELPKTASEEWFFYFVLEYLINAQAHLLISPPRRLEIERIHLMSDKGHELKFGRHPRELIYDSNSSASYVNKEKISFQIDLLILIVHEMFRHLGKKRYKLSGEEKKPVIVQNGYNLYNLNNNSTAEFFVGLDEAIINIMTVNFFQKYWFYLQEHFELGTDDLHYLKFLPNHTHLGFQNYAQILKMLIGNLATRTNSDPRVLFMQFERGFFTGEMTHLAQIEKVYSRGTLRMLALMGVWDINRPRLNDVNYLETFIRAKNNEERRQIFKRFLAVTR